MKSNPLKKKLKDIRLFVTDFDGVHTNGLVYINQNMEETVVCSRKDGLGIDMLKRSGIEVCVISKETNPVVEARCRKLKIDCHQKIHDSEGKLNILKRIVSEKNLTSANILYIGDDINDIDCLRYAGVAVTVSDSHPKLPIICDYITKQTGGNNAIREVCELLLDAQGHDLSF